VRRRGDSGAVEARRARRSRRGKRGDGRRGREPLGVRRDERGGQRGGVGRERRVGGGEEGGARGVGEVDEPAVEGEEEERLSVGGWRSG
jgi:hypothetical protein